MAGLHPSRYSVVLVLVLLGCGEKGGPEPPGAAKPLAKAAEAPAVDPVENFLASVRAYNQNSVRDFLETHTEDATWQMAGSGVSPVEGRKRIARQGVAFKTAFPESRYGVRRVLVQGKDLAVQFALHATRRFDEQGIEVPPRELGYEAFQVVETERGRVRRTIVLHDQLGLRQQAGLVEGTAPPVPTLPEEPEIVRGPPPAGYEDALAEWNKAWEAGDFGLLKDRVSDDFEVLDRTTGERIDREGAAKWLADRGAKLDGVRFERVRTVAAGSWVAALFEESVDFREPGAGAGAAPRRITLSGAHVMRLADGRIAAVDIYYNRAEVLRLTSQADGGPDAGDAGPSGAPDPEKTKEND